MKRAAALAAVLATLYWFPPSRYGFYPRCPIYACTGWLCPGCGATRALAALLHGRLQEALGFNWFFVAVVLPVGVGYLAIAMLKGRWVRIPVPAVWVFGVMALSFAVARNLT